MIIADSLHPNQTATKSKISTKQIVDIWMSMPNDYSEQELGHHFISKIFDYLGCSHHQVKIQPNIGLNSTLKPDYLIYNDPAQPPVLAIEIKKRVAILATVSDGNFLTTCESHPLYRDAVGLSTGNNNGILQYLDITKVQPQCLSTYGLVCNGDFFQLWRRVDNGHRNYRKRVVKYR